MRLARKHLALKGDVQVLEMMTWWLLQTQLSGHASWGFYSSGPGLASLVGHPSRSRPRNVYCLLPEQQLFFFFFFSPVQWISPVPSGDGICCSSSKSFRLFFWRGVGRRVQQGTVLACSQAPPCPYVSPVERASSLLTHSSSSYKHLN